MSSAYNLILGPMELGNAFNCILFGIICVQYYRYITTFNDPRWLRWTVLFVFLLDTVQTAIMIYMVWEYTVTYFNHPEHLAKSSWSIGVIPFFSVPISWVVQWFFAWRLYQLTGKTRALPAFIVLVSVIQGLAGIGCGIGAFLLTSIDDFPKLQRIAIVWFVGSILCDALISAAMLYYLLSVRTGYRDTDKLVHTIARGVIETGLATTTIVILDAIFFFRMPLTNMHLCVVMIAGKTYSNSMLYMLNARRAYRRISRGGESTDFPSFSGDPRVQAGRVEGTTSATAGGVYRGGRQRHSGRRHHAGGSAGGGPRRKQTLTELVFERPRLRSNGEYGISSDEDDDDYDNTADIERRGQSAGTGGTSAPTGTTGQSTGTYSLSTLDSDGKRLARAQSRESDTSDGDRKGVDVQVSTETEVVVDDGNFGVRSLPALRSSAIQFEHGTVVLSNGREPHHTGSAGTRSHPVRIDESQLRPTPSTGTLQEEK